MKNKLIIISLIGLLAIGCNTNTMVKVNGVKDPLIISDSTKFSQAVFLTNDNNGNPVVAWSMAATDSGQYKLVYRRFDKESMTFENVLKVEETLGMQAHHESMAKVGFKRNGDIMAVYRREDKESSRRFAGNIFYTESSDAGKSWSEERKLVEDSTSASQSFYDVDRLGNGELGVTWLDSRRLEQKEGSSIFFNQTSANGGFVGETGILGSTCQCCRTELNVSMDGKLDIAFRDIINDSIRDMVHTYSLDNGKTFSPGKRISNDNWIINGCPHTGPTIATNDTKRAVAWFTMGGGKGVYFTLGENSEDTSPDRILIDAKALHPQMVWNGSSFALAYELVGLNDGKKYRQIVISFIDENGSILETRKISPDGEDSLMPVLRVINDDYLLISWVRQNDQNKSLIMAKIIATDH